MKSTPFVCEFGAQLTVPNLKWPLASAGVVTQLEPRTNASRKARDAAVALRSVPRLDVCPGLLREPMVVATMLTIEGKGKIKASPLKRRFNGFVKTLVSNP